MAQGPQFEYQQGAKYCIEIKQFGEIYGGETCSDAI